MANDILTLSEVAEYLKVGEKTIQRMIARDEIPCMKVGGQWRFMRQIIDQWLMERMRKSSAPPIASPELPLSRLTRERWIIPALPVGEPAVVLNALIEPWCAEGIVPRRDEFLAGLLARESMVSTVLGQGIAMPHVRQPHENPAAGPCLAIGRIREGVPFGLPNEDERACLFFLPMTRDEGEHVRLLARLARLARRPSFRQDCMAAEGAAEIMATLIRHEQQELINPSHREL